MNIRATGHAAAVVAAGLWICVINPVHANDAVAQAPEPAAAVGSATDTSAEPAKPSRRHTRKSASKSHKTAHQAKAGKPAEDAAKSDTAKADDPKPEPDNAMPPTVANANAQWPADASPANTYNVSAQAGSVLSQMGAKAEQPATAAPDESAGNAQLVASDQLNDLDRAAEDKPPLTLAKATIDTPPPAAATSTDSNSPWEHTSIVGKIFIALGGLLTVASAARMFMA